MLPKIPSLLDIKQNSVSCPNMNNQQFQNFLNAAFMEQENADLFSLEDAKKFGFFAEVMQKRLEFSGTNATFPCAIFVLTLCNKVSDVVLWSYTLNRMFKKFKKNITLQELANCFPCGFPIEEEVNKIWDAQKGYNYDLKIDNIIDYDEVWNYE